MLSFIFWNIFSAARLSDWPDALAWIANSTALMLQETLQHRAITPLPDKTPLSVPARLTGGPGRPSGGLTTYISNGALGGARFEKIVSEPFFLCVRIVHGAFSFILGNVYLPLCTAGTSETMVSEFEGILSNVLSLYPTDPVVIGGDFNCHLFSQEQTSPFDHEAQFKIMVRRLRTEGFTIYPEQEIPFTYNLELDFSTIDYVMVRGLRVLSFEVADKFSGITSHRPLYVTVDLPAPIPHDNSIHLSQALGGAYFKSETKKETLRDLLQLIAEDGVVDCVQSTYDQVANDFEICTKRTARRLHSEPWEHELDPQDADTLNLARREYLQHCQKLTPAYTAAELEEVKQRRDIVEGLQTSMKQEAVRRITERQQRQAQHHASTWKLLSAFKASSDQPEVPPAAIYEHYRNISQDPTAPLTVELRPRRWQGPMTREDAALEDDVTPEEAEEAILTSNMTSAPGPDGLPPTMIKSVFSTYVLLSFLARLFTACFRKIKIPQQWRKAENFVLYKGRGDKWNVSSFRAISLTASLAKIYKRVLFRRFWTWFTTSRLFSLPQFGFRPRSATIDSVFVLLSVIREHTLVQKKAVYVAFIDITKAFPSLDRFRLFNR